MPTFRHGKGTVVLSNQYDLSGYLNSLTHTNAVEIPETTTFGSTDRSYITGHTDGSVSFEGLFDGTTNGTTVGATADGVDKILSDALGSDTARVMSVAGDGAAIGRRAVLVNAKSTSYEVTSPLTDVVAISGEAVADSGLDYGVWLAGNTSVSTTLNATSVDNAALSTNGGVAHLHVTANTRNGTTVAKVQSSADNSTWADLVTFATISTTTVTSERVVVAAGTSVPRYLRAQVTPAGSTGALTVSIAFSRR